ncbi:glycosyltransferase family 2 protein [Pontibacter populi]|uniref:Glycosyltransferase family 2 protein n=1 Tax=Pontibacter populi TaxID=890055 RepID=A0ABV1RVC9_9BACT
MKISILTPSFNSGAYLERAILSVLNQNYDNIEHVVVDGGSKDNTVEILRKYQHIKWVSEKDEGQSDAMNKAFSMSTGDILVYLNADDYFEPGVFHTVVTYFKRNPECEILVGNLYHETESTGEKRLMKYAHEYKKILLHFKYGFPFNPVAYFYKRNVQEKIGKFPVEEHYAMDYWFLLNAFKVSEVFKIDKVFGTFCKTGDNKTSDSDSKEICKGIAMQHIGKANRKILYNYNFHYLLDKVFMVKYYYKQPVKLFAFYLFFNKSISYKEYNKIGFKAAWGKKIK